MIEKHLGRPKGTKKLNARIMRITIPLTSEERQKIYSSTEFIWKNVYGYVDTIGATPVIRRLLLDVSNMIIKSQNQIGVTHD